MFAFRILNNAQFAILTLHSRDVTIRPTPSAFTRSVRCSQTPTAWSSCGARTVLSAVYELSLNIMRVNIKHAVRVVSHQSLAVEVRARSRVSLRENCGGQASNGTGLSPSTSIF